jgi:signal transduction histidine kinase
MVGKLEMQNFAPILNWMDNNITTELLVNEIEEAAKRINALITNIKSYSHMDRANVFEPTQLREGLESTLQLLKFKLKTNKVEVDFQLPDNFPLALAKGGEINQVFTNIIDNAIDAMPNGGKLTIRGEYNSEGVTVIIKDNGPGIPDAIKTSVFDPFFTTKEVGKGTGLGLDIARKIILAHKGVINFETSPTEGTEFWICLPLAHAENEA